MNDQPRRSRWRRAARGIALFGGGLVGVCALALGAGMAWLNTAPGNDWLRDLILEHTKPYLPDASLEMDGLYLNMLRGELELRQVRLVRWDGVPLLVADQVSLDLGPIRLLRQSLTVDEIVLHRPTVRVESLEDGQLDWLRALGVASDATDTTDTTDAAEPPTAWEGMGMQIGLGELRIEEGAVFSVAPGTAFLLDDINLSLGAHVGGGAMARIEDLSLSFTPGPYANTQLSGDVQYLDSTVTVERLALVYEQSRAEIVGTVKTVEIDPTLALDLNLSPIAKGAAAQFTNDMTPAKPINVAARIEGPLRALGVGLTANSEAGIARLQAQADLQADPMTWSAALDADRLSIDALVPAVTEPVVLAGRYAVSGAGTAYPDGITAHVDVQAPEQTIWGQPVESLLVDADLQDGTLTFQKATARHPVGEATIVSGQIDLVQETVNLQTDLLLPTLQRLDQFGLDGFRGSVRARGPVAVRYGGDEPAVDVGLRVDGRNIGSPDFELAAVRSSDLTVKVRGSTVSWSGGATVEGLNASGVLIESIALSELSGQYLPTGELSASTAVDLSSLIVGDGTFVLNGLSGTVDGGVDASGQPVLATNLVLGEMAVEPIGFALDGGPLELTLAEDALMARVSLSRKERLVIETIARGDLEAGHWTIEELFVFPAEDRGLANPVSVPIEFDLVEDGVDNVKAVLVLSSQRPDDVNPRQVSLQEASTLTFTGATLGGLPDIRVDAQRVNMNWVSAMANTFLSEGDELFLPVMEGVLDGHVALEGEADEASVDGDLHLKGFVYPEQAEDINVDLALEGRLGRPTATMRVSGPKKLIAAMDAVVPLNVEEGYTIDCESDLGVRALLAPRSLDALGARLPALAGMPAGSISGDAYVFGDACDPEIHVFGMFSGPVGVHGEYARLDARIERKGEDLDLAMNLIEGGLRWMRVDGHVTHRLADVFAMTLGGGPAIDLNDPSAIITDFEVRASPTNVSLPLLAQLGGADLELDGDLRGALVVSGTPGEPVVHGDLSIVKGRIGDVRLNQAEVHLHPANESDKDGYLMDVDFAFGRANGQGRHSGRPLRLALDGFVPVTLAEMIYDEDPMSDTGWRLTIEDGAIPMELMNGVSDAVIDVSGTLLFGGEIKEDLVNPSSRLDLQVHDGQMILTDPVDVHYEHMDIGMSLDAGTFQIHRGHLVPPSSDEDQGLRNPCFDKEQAGADPRQLGGCFSATPRYAQLNVGRIGMLELLGGFSLNGFTPEKLRFEMTMQDFWLAASNQFQFATTGGMTMTGDWPAFTLRGDVTLNQGAVNLDSTFFSADASLKLDDRITIQNRNDGSRELVVAAPEDDLTSEVFEKFDAKVSLNLNNKLNLEMEYPLSTDFGQQFAELSSFLMDVELDGALEAGMTEGDIFVSGDVEITDGTASTLGREFSVEPDSTITFTGKDYTNPFVDLSARYTTSSYGDVLMSVNGFVSPTVPTPAFSSENGPQEYDETDIMSLLLLGKPASTLADSEGESNSYLLSAALSSLSGQVGGALTGSFVDEVDIDPQQGVRVGKALSERLFLTYDWNSDADETDNVNEVALEWTISPSLYAEFLTGDRAQSSVSLFWRRIFGVASSDAPKAPPPSPAPAPAPEPTPEPGAEDPTSAPAPTP